MYGYGFSHLSTDQDSFLQKNDKVSCFPLSANGNFAMIVRRYETKVGYEDGSSDCGNKGRNGQGVLGTTGGFC